jgi:hypothetical protein
LDEDKAGLNRPEQLVLALSIIHIKKIKGYRMAHYKISINNAATLSEILEKAKIKVKFSRCNQKEILLTLIPSKIFFRLN